jgi:hypothetical protein
VVMEPGYLVSAKGAIAGRLQDSFRRASDAISSAIE